MSGPPWTIGAVTLVHVTPQAYDAIPAGLRDTLTAFYWTPLVMSAFPADRDWHLATCVLTDLAWWMTCVPRLPAAAIFSELAAFIPRARAVADMAPCPAPAPSHP